MDKKNTEKSKWSIERKALVGISMIFVGVILSGWGYALRLRHMIVANNAASHADQSVLIEVEHLRNLAESQIANSRSFFLLGAKSIFDKQKAEKEDLKEALAKFEKQYDLANVSSIIKRIEGLQLKNQEFFEQAMDFREKKTESKIVGQFFHSKVNPLQVQLNEAFDEIASLHKAELDRARKEAREAALNAEIQVPIGMAWFTGLISILFLGMVLLVIRMLRERPAQVAERNRLYEEAKKAIHSRDEAIFAISNDLKEPLNEIKTAAVRLKKSSDNPEINDVGELIESTVVVIEGMIQDIRDQKSSEIEGITLRLDQLSIDDVLESARHLVQPMAKKYDVRVQFDTVNPPVLAFYDRERVLRVLSNLIGNAIKFSPKGSKVVVKVRSDQKFVNISVLDNGSGIPAVQLPEIFDNFWQARKTADQGAGVGLAIVKTIIEAHGGMVQAQSQVGRGSTFTFSLPRRRPVGAPLRKVAPIVKITPTAPSQDYIGKFPEGPSH